MFVNLAKANKINTHDKSKTEKIRLLLIIKVIGITINNHKLSLVIFTNKLHTFKNLYHLAPFKTCYVFLIYKKNVTRFEGCRVYKFFKCV